MSDIVNNMTQICVGSPNIEASVAEAEILLSSSFIKAFIDRGDKIRVINFELKNFAACHISINNGEYVYYGANEGVKFGNVYSCKIQENGINYNWTADIG